MYFKVIQTVKKSKIVLRPFKILMYVIPGKYPVDMYMCIDRQNVQPSARADVPDSMSATKGVSQSTYCISSYTDMYVLEMRPMHVNIVC